MPKRYKHRLFVDQKLFADSEIGLGDEQTHYVRRVLRLRSADTVLCFNGGGCSYVARILEDSGKHLRLALEAEHEFQAEAMAQIHLVLSLTKKPDKVFQKASELGVTDIWPASSQRSELRVSTQRMEQKLQHWKAIIISSCEQTGRNRIPRLHNIRKLAEVIQNPPCANTHIFHPGAPLFSPAAAVKDTCLVIGPEGGWSDEEVELAKNAGFIFSGFGNNVLRADTAPVAALSILQHQWNWQLG